MNDQNQFPSVSSLYWIRVDAIQQPGQQNLKLKPKVVTQSYLILPDGKPQYTLQLCDWDIVTPEALWLGTYTQAIRIVAECQKYTSIECRILPLSPSFFIQKNGKIILDFTEKNHFINELVNEPVNAITTAAESLSPKPETSQISVITLTHTLADFLLPKDTVKKIIQSRNRKNPGANIFIFYYREPLDFPSQENVLRYNAVFARFQPQLPRGWRYLCSLATYTEQLYQRMKSIVEKTWHLTWSEKNFDTILETILDDNHLLTQIIADILNNIIRERELLGNELHIATEITEM